MGSAPARPEPFPAAVRVLVLSAVLQRASGGRRDPGPGVRDPEREDRAPASQLRQPHDVLGGLPAEPEWQLPLGTSLDFSELTLLASNPANLVDRLDRLLLHGTMSDALRGAIVDAVAAVDPGWPEGRAYQALYLVAVSSQYQIQR